MPLPLLAIAAGALAAKGISKIAGHKSKTKANDEQRRATTAQLTTGQKMREDVRRARLDTANSLLGGVPATTAGGAVNTNVALDPELVKRLGIERTYDFGSTVPNMNKGATWALLSGLFGDAGNFAADYGMSGMGGGFGSGGSAAASAAGPVVGDSGILSGGGAPSMAGGPSTLTWEDLYRAQGEGMD